MYNLILNFKTLSLYDWECIMFSIAILLIPFHTGHMALSISIFGSMGSKLSIFPLMIGLCFFLYQCIKKREWYVPKIYSAFFCILFVWQMLSLIHGLLIFPDWQEISANQFKKLDFLLSILSSKGFFLNSLAIGRTWWAIKLIFTHILEYGVTYGVVIWGISLFYQNRNTSFQALRYGILGGAIICSIYSVIEFLYLFGSYDAMGILAYINPCIYDIEIAHGWWPPLLGGNRVRSVFAEPAYMALYLTVTIPFLLAQIRVSKTKKWFWKVLFAMQLFMMWGTNSKTAMGILLAEALSAIIFFYLRRKNISLKQVFSPLLIIILLCGLGIGLNWLFQHRYAVNYDLISITSNTVTLKITNKSNIVWEKRTGINLTSAWFTKDWKDESGRVNVPLDRTLLPGQSCEIIVNLPEPISKEEYPNVVMELVANNAFQNNIRLASQGAAKFTLQWNQNHLVDKGLAKPLENKMTAMTSQTEGSNQQRYGMMYVEMLVGRDHPFFGVGGQELKQAYLVSYIPDWLMKNREVQLWVTYQKTKGMLKSGFPIISDYTHQFASYGFPGFILFLLPSFCGLILLFKEKYYWLTSGSQEYLHIAILGISYFGLMIAFIGGNSTQIYIYWLLLGALIGYYGTLGRDNKPQ